MVKKNVRLLNESHPLYLLYCAHFGWESILDELGDLTVALDTMSKEFTKQLTGKDDCKCFAQLTALVAT